MFHLVDWMPTLLEAAGSTELPKHIDGKSHWKEIVNVFLGQQTNHVVRNDLVYNCFPEGECVYR